VPALNFAIYTLANSLILSAIPLLVPLLGWDWIAVNGSAVLILLLAAAASRTLWSRYSVLLFWLWAGFIAAVCGAFASNVFRYFLR